MNSDQKNIIIIVANIIGAIFLIWGIFIALEGFDYPEDYIIQIIVSVIFFGLGAFIKHSKT